MATNSPPGSMMTALRFVFVFLTYERLDVRSGKVASISSTLSLQCLPSVRDAELHFAKLQITLADTQKLFLINALAVPL